MSAVSRSAYQKLAEENKRLLNDIKILVEHGLFSESRQQVYKKWETKFKQDREFNNTLRELLTGKKS